MEQNKVRRLVLMGMFVALSFVGSNIKIFSSIAFDSFPPILRDCSWADCLAVSWALLDT